jgi:7-keto-8-aminopelargonate synthetase-like enzyme
MELIQHCDQVRALKLIVIRSMFLLPVSHLVKLLKPSDFFTYHQVCHSKILHGARLEFSVLCGFHNRQRLLLYTSLTEWFLTVVESVYSAVRFDSLYKSDYVSSF